MIHFLEIRSLQNSKKIPEKCSQFKKNFFNFFTKNITYLESTFNSTNSNYLCALKPFFPEKERFVLYTS